MLSVSKIFEFRFEMPFKGVSVEQNLISIKNKDTVENISVCGAILGR